MSFPRRFGEVSEWSKVRLSKSRAPQKGAEGSNPSLSANFEFRFQNQKYGRREAQSVLHPPQNPDSARIRPSSTDFPPAVGVWGGMRAGFGPGVFGNSAATFKKEWKIDMINLQVIKLLYHSPYIIIYYVHNR